MAKTLREVLRQRGLRSNWVAEQLGLGESCFSRLANGRGYRSLDLEQIARLAEILELDVAEVRGMLLADRVIRDWPGDGI